MQSKRVNCPTRESVFFEIGHTSQGDILRSIQSKIAIPFISIRTLGSIKRKKRNAISQYSTLYDDFARPNHMFPDPLGIAITSNPGNRSLWVARKGPRI